MASFSAEVVRICDEQWKFFDQGKRKEYQSKVFRRIGQYWKEGTELSGRDGRTDVIFLKLNGRPLDKNDPEVIVPDRHNRNPPWSAAFISFVAKTAGAGDGFIYSRFHSRYILAALREAANPGSTANFIARRHTSFAPKIGDLIATGRESAKTATFDTAENFKDRDDFFPSHCDFVVEIDPAGRFLKTVGGNVGNSVGQKTWPLNAARRIGDKDPRSSASNVICIMDCRLP